MASASNVKPEPGIKPEPEDASASPAPGFEDDDLYEDAGDLEFWDPASQPYAGNVYLTHVPKYLYEAWEHLDDDAEIRIGTVRQWTETDAKGQVKQRIAMLLDHTKANHQNIPKEYNLEVKDMQLKNTFLFTEQDLPGFKNRGQGANSNIPAHLRRSREQQKAGEEQQPQQQAGRRKGRYQPYYRKAIPKKTVLAGRFAHELNCQPVMTAEAKHHLDMRTNDAMRPRATTKIAAGSRGMPSNVIQAGAHNQNDKFSSFVRTAPEPKKVKKQNHERAARLGKSELRDKLFECFDRHTYWSMRAFKQDLRQPEAWLRENLDELALLHKSGPFANHWALKPEYKRASIQATDGAAPDDGFTSDDDADDENIEMEDVA